MVFMVICYNYYICLDRSKVSFMSTVNVKIDKELFDADSGEEKI